MSEVEMYDGASAAERPATTPVQSGGAFLIQGEHIDIQSGGGTLLTAGQDMNITAGGGSVLIAGGNMQIEKGGGAVLIAGGNATIRGGRVGVLIAGGGAELGEDARVLLNTPQALAFGAACGLVLALAGFLLRRGARRA